MVDESRFVEVASESIENLLGKEDAISISEERVELLRQALSEEDVGQYKNALISAFLLSVDADVRTSRFWSQITPWRHRMWSHPIDGHYEAFIYSVGKALQSYREPAETIVALVQELIGTNELLPQLDCREKRWLDARVRKEAELVDQWTENQIGNKPELISKPSPHYLSPNTKNLRLETMRRYPDGIQVLNHMLPILERFHPDIEGIPNPMVYGFRLGTRRYVSALNTYFR